MSIWRPICGDSSRKSKFLAEGGKLYICEFSAVRKDNDFINRQLFKLYHRRRKHLQSLITTSFSANKNRGSMDPGLCFILSRRNHHLWRVIPCVNVITLFLLAFTLTLVGNFLNILHAVKSLNLSRNKQIKRINLKTSKKIGYRLRPRHDDVVVKLRNAALLLSYYFFP